MIQRFAYSAYGDTVEGPGLTAASAALTSWLFAGDGAYDAAADLTYHLARWRDGGRWLTDDPFAGLVQDPQSLHKYLYAHANPILYTDPTGRLSLVGKLSAISISSILVSIGGGALGYKAGGIETALKGAALGGITGLAISVTAIYAPKRLPKVVLQGISVGTTTALSHLISDYQDNQTINDSAWMYSFAFFEGFSWGVAGEAFGGPIWDRLNLDEGYGAFGEAFAGGVTAMASESLKEIGEFITGKDPLTGEELAYSVSNVFVSGLEAAIATTYVNEFVSKELANTLSGLSIGFIRGTVGGALASPINNFVEKLKL